MVDKSEINLLQIISTPSPKIRLVKFEASWCGPCKAMTPILQRLVDAFDEVLEVYTVDVDDNPEFANHYSVRSVPTIVLHGTKGEFITRFTGMVRYEQISVLVNGIFGVVES